MGIEKAVIDRTDRLIPLSCMEVEDENDDEDENDWGRKYLEALQNRGSDYAKVAT